MVIKDKYIGKIKEFYEEDSKLSLHYHQYGVTKEKIRNPWRYYFLYRVQIALILFYANPKKKTVLDLGCGSAIISKKLIPIVDKLYGIDISKKRVKQAKTHVANLNNLNNFDFYVSYAQNLPFKDNHFDVIIASEIIEHVIDVKIFLEECKRVLKSDGLLVLSTPAGRNYELIGSITNDKVDEHLRLYSHKELRKIVNDNGFFVEDIYGVGFSPRFKLNFPSPEDIFHHLNFRSKFFGSKFISVCRLIGRLFPKYSQNIVVKARKP